jgi:hypothetical protein
MKSTNPVPMTEPAGVQLPSSTPLARQTRMDVGPSKDEIARRAYFIYLDQGCPQGQDLQHWFAAETQMMAAPNLGRQNISAKG